MGFVTDVQRKDGHWDLVLNSNKKVSRQATEHDKQKTVLIDPKFLVGNGWKANVWAAFEATFEGRLISRKKLKEISGVPEVTQRAYDKQAGVHRVANYAVSNIHANGFSAVLDYGNRAALFKYWDRNTHQLKLGWRIPDSRAFSHVQTNGSKKTRRALSLFNRTQESLTASMQQISKNDLPIRELYLFSHTSKHGSVMWTHVPLV
jgi:hypothetical protein